MTSTNFLPSNTVGDNCEIVLQTSKNRKGGHPNAPLEEERKDKCKVFLVPLNTRIGEAGPSFLSVHAIADKEKLKKNSDTSILMVKIRQLQF